MQISISGSTGFIGKHLIKKFSEKGWKVNVIHRDSFRMPDEEFAENMINNADVIINLAGAIIAKRWSTSWKKEIVDSRIETTRKIADGILLTQKKSRLFISPSAVGIYDSIHRHDEESNFLSKGFLADVCREWENQALRVKDSTRLVIFRTGVVLGNEGGVLQKLYPVFSKGLGGPIGNGKAMMSWIHIHDLVGAYLYVIGHGEIEGIINLVSPDVVTNHYFTRTLGKVLNMPAIVTVPLFLLKILYGEGANALTTGQDAIPAKLIKNGFIFKYPTIEKALMDLYK
jgi:uncharacterized protein (TIGR01777 family)